MHMPFLSEDRTANMELCNDMHRGTCISFCHYLSVYYTDTSTSAVSSCKQRVVSSSGIV